MKAPRSSAPANLSAQHAPTTFSKSKIRAAKSQSAAATTAVTMDTWPRYGRGRTSTALMRRARMSSIASLLLSPKRHLEGPLGSPLPIDQEEGVEEVPAITDPLVRRGKMLMIAFNFMAAPLADNLAPFLAVYLVAVLGRSAGEAGLILSVREISKLIFQLPAGWLIDATPHKKLLLCIACAVISVSAVSVIALEHTAFLVTKSIVEGAAQAVIDPLRGAVILGMVGKQRFDSVAEATEAANHAGQLFSAVAAGVIAYLSYPDVTLLFALVGAMGVIAIACVVAIPPYRTTPGPNGEKVKLINDAAARNESDNGSEGEARRGDNGQQQEEKQACPLCNLLCRRANIPILIFAASVFFHHFGNAAVLPLLSQFVSVDPRLTGASSAFVPGAEANCTNASANCSVVGHLVHGQEGAGRASIPYTSANIAIAQTSSVLTVLGMGKMLQLNMGYKLPMFIGFGSLPIRCAAIVLLIEFWPNTYALIATQLIDGVGAGVVKMASFVVTRALTQQTGHFGLAMGLVQVADNLGGSCSNLVGGYLVDATAYGVGFLFMGVVGSVPFVLVCFLREPGGLEADRVDAYKGGAVKVTPPHDARAGDSLAFSWQGCRYACVVPEGVGPGARFVATLEDMQHEPS